MLILLLQANLLARGASEVLSLARSMQNNLALVNRIRSPLPKYGGVGTWTLTKT